MEFLNKKQKTILIIIGTIIVIFVGCYIIKKTLDYKEYEELEIAEQDNISLDTSIQNEEEIIDEEIIVHITGQVVNEGIIKIKEDSRIADVIEKAGGVTEEADLSKINLAYQVKDGQKIYIPNINDKENKKEEQEYITEDAGDNIIIEGKENGNKVNINTATQTELETLSGVGPSTALKIINYRKENGEFKQIEDIKNVPGIGEAKFEGLREEICVK